MSVKVLIVVGLYFIVANLPFLFDRVLFIWSRPSGRKGAGWQFLELLLFYLVFCGFASLLEMRDFGIASVYQKNWQFYVAMLCLFFVFAFPGFVYCHLWRGNRRRAMGSPREQE